jgi:hypothetical protein
VRCWSCSSIRMHGLLAVFAGRFTADAQGRLDALRIGAQAPQGGGDGVVALVKPVEDRPHPGLQLAHGLVVVRERPPVASSPGSWPSAAGPEDDVEDVDDVITSASPEFPG